ncbi:NUDIX domain-containing protein [Comamonas humi]
MSDVNAAPAWAVQARQTLQAAPLQPRIPFVVDGHVVGSLLEHFLLETGLPGRLAEGVLLIKREHAGQAVWVLEYERGDATAALNHLAKALHEAGRSGAWRSEQLLVRSADGHIVGTVERGAVRPLGIATQAVHLVGLASQGDGWVQQRSARKDSYPNRWDTLMGGMVSASDTLEQALARETWEEAGLRVAELQALHWGGVLRFRQPATDGDRDGRGLSYMHEDIHWYRCTVPDGLVPDNQDGEVQQFACWPRDRLLEQLAADAFTPEATLVWAGHFGW